MQSKDFAYFGKKVAGFILYCTRTSMKKYRDKIKNNTQASGEKSPQKNIGVERQRSNLCQIKKQELQTADKILLYMQEEEKY